VWTLPSVVIIGRPNVGKSTLFNAILGRRRAIVGDEPGITRDRIRGQASHRGREFELVDTGGILAGEDAAIPREVLKQARVALDGAAHVILLVDGRAEITAADRDLAAMLRKRGKPVTLAVNKIDSPRREDLAQEFYTLGFKHLFPISAEHHLGIAELLDHVTSGFPAPSEQRLEPEAPAGIRVAIIGRPNVGKSTLLNALIGAERAIVTEEAGTTRDAVDEAVRRDGVEYVFVDTAGIRRKGKTRGMAEKLSVVMARRHLRMSHVALLVLDATQGVVAGDATIAGYAHEEGRALILCVNKWDAAENRDKRAFLERIRDELKFAGYAPVAFVAAQKGHGTAALFPLIRRVHESASRRVPTGELNRFAESLRWEHGPKIRYLTQAAVRPPTFVVFLDKPRLHFSAQRNLINQLREEFGFEGTPVVVKVKRPARDVKAQAPQAPGRR
jgi:GTP-binding protein